MTRLLLTILLLTVLPAQAQDHLTVSPDGPMQSVAEALAQVAPGGTVVIEAGVYQEPPLVIDKPMTLQGQGDVILDGQSEHQILTITADSVTVRGLTFRNVGVSFIEDRAAVKVDDASHCLIENNHFVDTFFGIYLARTANCRVVGNELYASGETETKSGNGIHLWYCKNITVADNYITGHRDGIYFEFVEDSRVAGNLSERNLRYGLHFMFSDRCQYHDNTFQYNDAGVAVMYTEHVEMYRNRFAHNWGSAAYGLLLKDIIDSHIEGNVFEQNTIGMYAEGSNRVVIQDNTFRENGWAVKIMANALDNEFTRNSFVANTFDVATNSRQSYSTFDGNYWDKYQGYDLDRDGVGDVPFRPVRLFALLVEQNEPSLLLLRSMFVDLLDAAERVLPVLTPETLVDTQPAMHPPMQP